MSVPWRPSAEDVQRVAVEQNPWHRSGTVPASLARHVERPLASLLARRLLDDEPHRFQLVLGPRRVGKTTALYQTVRHLLHEGVDPARLWWMRLDHPLLLAEPLGDLVRAAIETTEATEDRPVFLFLDELVHAEGWDLWLKAFYDDRWPVRIAATSSATAALRERRMESGVGRWSEQHQAPYSFAEFLDLTGQRPDVAMREHLPASLAALTPRSAGVGDLSTLRTVFLLVGGFPELLTSSDPDEELTDWMLRSQQVLRSDAVERAVYKDIPQSFGVDSPLVLERLLYVLAAQITGVLSPTGICRDLGLSQPTLDRYLSYLERAFLVFTLPNYSGTESSVQRRGRKLYFVDGAVRNAALQRGTVPLSNPEELGALLENLVAATLRSLAAQTGTRLYHWRDGRHEVDLVFDHPTHPVAFEISSNPNHGRTGLRAFADRHRRFEGRSYLVAPGARVVQPERSSTGTGSLPLDAVLLLAGAHVDAALAANLATPGR